MAGHDKFNWKHDVSQDMSLGTTAVVGSKIEQQQNQYDLVLVVVVSHLKTCGHGKPKRPRQTHAEARSRLDRPCAQMPRGLAVARRAPTDRVSDRPCCRCITMLARRPSVEKLRRVSSEARTAAPACPIPRPLGPAAVADVAICCMPSSANGDEQACRPAVRRRRASDDRHRTVRTQAYQQDKSQLSGTRVVSESRRRQRRTSDYDKVSRLGELTRL